MKYLPAIKVAILENHQSIVDGYLYRLGQSNGIEVVGAVYYGNNLDGFMQDHPVDVLIMAAYVPVSAEERAAYPVLNVIPSLFEKYPALHILIISVFSNPVFIKAVSELGVSGYIQKSDQDAILSLARIVRHVANGGIHFSYGAPEDTLLGADGNYKLTTRQLEVLSLLAASPGCSTYEVASKLGVADSTVRNLLSRAYAVLGVRNRVAAINRVQELGILPGAINSLL